MRGDMADVPESLQGEAEAFDRRMEERVSNGLIPDLRRCQRCDWFYNNPWRHPSYVEMVFGGYLNFALAHVPPAGSHVLEVGSGLGHMSLELARHGYHVTGLDLSGYSIDVADYYRLDNSYEDGFGSLRYRLQDILNWDFSQQFDAACFFLTLHHFSPPSEVLDIVFEHLRPDGIIVVVEPARDWFSRLNATVIALIRLLLSSTEHWYEKLQLPSNELDLDRFISDIELEYREARDPTEEQQSPHDNSAYATDMIEALDARFTRLGFETTFAFVPRMVGGVRTGNEEQTLNIAGFLHLFDNYCVRRGLLQPGVFMYAGRKDLSPR